MPSTLYSIFEGIETTLETANGSLTVYLDAQSASPSYPNLVIGQTFEIEYDVAMGGNAFRTTLCMTLYVRSSTTSEAGWDEISEYISPTGTESIRAGIESDRTLDGSVDDAYIGSAVQVEREDLGGSVWEYRAKFELHVIKTVA